MVILNKLLLIFSSHVAACNESFPSIHFISWDIQSRAANCRDLAWGLPLEKC
jgi:hypothetical protein